MDFAKDARNDEGRRAIGCIVIRIIPVAMRNNRRYKGRKGKNPVKNLTCYENTNQGFL